MPLPDRSAVKVSPRFGTSAVRPECASPGRTSVTGAPGAPELKGNSRSLGSPGQSRSERENRHRKSAFHDPNGGEQNNHYRSSAQREASVKPTFSQDERDRIGPSASTGTALVRRFPSGPMERAISRGLFWNRNWKVKSSTASPSLSTWIS